MKRKVIIVGGSGFIGGHFKDYLSELEDVDIMSYDIRDGESYLDVRKKVEINENCNEHDIILNLAAVHTTPGHPDYEYFETNIYGAQNVCEFADRAGIKNIIFTSSIAPYGASEDLKAEETLPMPNTPYGISKLVAEGIHRTWAANDPTKKLMILRPGVVFGKGENGNFTRLAAAIKKGIFAYPGRKDTIKGCIYVKELVQQSWKLFKGQESGVSLYNFAYEPAFTIQEIVEAIADTTGNKKPSVLIPAFLLKSAAKFFQAAGLSRLGIHPDRVSKLMSSTNISGVKLKEAIGEYGYSFEEAIKDWYMDCEGRGLY